MFGFTTAAIILYLFSCSFSYLSKVVLVLLKNVWEGQSLEKRAFRDDCVWRRRNMEYDMYLMLKINCLGEVIYYERALSFLLLTHFYPIYASVSAYVIRSEESQILSFMRKINLVTF